MPTNTETHQRIYLSTSPNFGTSTFTGLSSDFTSTGAVTFSTPAGTEAKLTVTNKSGLEPTKGITTKLLFKLAKSKLTKIEQEVLKVRLGKLSSMIHYAKDMQQWAIYEESGKKILEVVREQEALLQGVDKYISRKDILRFVKLSREKIIKFKDFSEFHRVLPVKVRKTLKNLQNKQIFDNYEILFTDLAEPKEEIKSTKEKIKEKDPILFGSFKDTPDKLYYIADWIDEYCTLTFNELVETLTDLDQDYQVEFIPEITASYVSDLKKEIIENQLKLKGTNNANYRRLMEEEDQKRREAATVEQVIQETVVEVQDKQPNKKESLLRRLFRGVRSSN